MLALMISKTLQVCLGFFPCKSPQQTTVNFPCSKGTALKLLGYYFYQTDKKLIKDCRDRPTVDVHLCVVRSHPMTRVLWYFEFIARDPAVYQSKLLWEPAKTWKWRSCFCAVQTTRQQMLLRSDWLQVEATWRALHCSTWKQDADTSFPLTLCRNPFYLP